MERLPEIFYSIENDNIQDKLWTPDSILADEEGISVEDSEEDIFFDVEDELTDEESSNLLSHLKSNLWWTKNNDFTDEELHLAYTSVTDGIPTTFAEAMKSEDKSAWKAAMDVEMHNIRDNDKYFSN